MNVKNDFVEWINQKGIYKGINIVNYIDNYLSFLDENPFEINDNLSNIEDVKKSLLAKQDILKTNDDFIKFNSASQNGVPSALMGSNNFFIFINDFEKEYSRFKHIEYFNLKALYEYQKVANTNYDSNTPEANWFYDTRTKLETLVTLLGIALDKNFHVVYTEKPNGQKGRGKILFKNYVLTGFAPQINMGDDLFIKVSFTNLKDKPLFAADLDMNFRKGTSKYINERDKIYSESLKEWEVNDNFPNDWPALIHLLKPKIRELLETFNQMLPPGKNITENANNSDFHPHSLNQILYGPPGTGKTYATITKAIAIVDDISEKEVLAKYPDRKVLKDYFTSLFYDHEKKEGQIAFTTFHQSMSYEDFVEGIKPNVNNKNVEYAVKPGIFQQMSETATDNWLDSKKGKSSELSFEEAFTILKEEVEEEPDTKFAMKKEGKDFKIIGFTDKSIQFEKSSGSTNHTLSINTLRDYFYGNKEIRLTGIGIYYPSIIEKLKSYKATSVIDKAQKRYVLIIDEINRGNISAIFGELITLLEADKRLGEDEALEVILPYSQDKFGVPSNLYIIGTMNTADRSVEALDTALRRRFSFVEMMPNHDILDREVEGFNLKNILETINNRVEALLDRDHTIGHSYFIKVNDKAALIKAFENCIIPLLQEYFYGDYEKINLVLGDGFICKDKKNTVVFAGNNFNSGYVSTERYIFPALTEENIDSAIRKLLNIKEAAQIDESTEE